MEKLSRPAGIVAAKLKQAAKQAALGSKAEITPPALPVKPDIASNL